MAVEGLSPVGCMWFGSGFLSRFGLDPNLCVSCRLDGDDSMAPTLPAGSAVLADEKRRERVQGRPYMVYLPGSDRPTVRRAERNGRGWRLECDNPSAPGMPWRDDVDLVGQVVWTGRVVGME